MTLSPRAAFTLSRRAVLGAGLAAPFVARAAEAVVLRIGDQKGGMQSLLQASREAEGAPYRIEWKRFSQAQPLLEAQNAGQIDLSFAGDVAFLFFYASGAPIKAIGGSISDGRSSAILVGKNSPVRSVAELKGRTIALSHAGLGEPLVYGALENAGVSVKDVRIANLAQSDARAALATGAVDAWASWHPFVAMAEIEDGARVLIDGRGILPSRTFAIAHHDALRDKRAALADVQRRIARSWLWARAHQEDYARTLSEATGLSEAVSRRSVTASDRRPIDIDAAAVAQTAVLAGKLNGYGLLREIQDVPAAFDTGFAVGAAS